MLAEGVVIGGKYRLVRSLGEGGMGAVWSAKNEVIGRDVAVKVMLPHLAKDSDALRRFFNEARICASIRDPGIVDVFDMGTADDGSPFIVMELLNGTPLDKLFGRLTTLRPEALVPIVRDVAHTLALTHQQDVVHRDLKPANVFLHAGPKNQTVVKILDFGVSKVMTDSSPTITRTGAVLGSPAYMSPEQAAGTAVDFKTDIYSLGVILYEGLSGRIPFEGTANANALLLALATKDPPALQSVAPDVPEVVLAIVARAMTRDKSGRFASAAEMAAALEAAHQQLATRSSQLPSRSSVSIVVRSSSGGSTVVSEGGATSLYIEPSATGAPSIVGPPAVPFAAPSPVGSPQRDPATANTSGPVSTTRPGLGPKAKPIRAMAIAAALGVAVAMVAGLMLVQRVRVQAGGAPSAVVEGSASAQEPRAEAPPIDASAVVSATPLPEIKPGGVATSQASAAKTSTASSRPTPIARQRPTVTATQAPRRPSADDFR